MYTGTAFIFSDIFDEYEYHRGDVEGEGEDQRPSEREEGEEDNMECSAFEIPLTTLIDCLNIFGSAGGAMYSNNSKHKRWKHDEDGGLDEDDGRRRGRTLGSLLTGPEKKTGMRMSYQGPGYPLTLVL